MHQALWPTASTGQPEGVRAPGRRGASLASNLPRLLDAQLPSRSCSSGKKYSFQLFGVGFTKPILAM